MRTAEEVAREVVREFLGLRDITPERALREVLGPHRGRPYAAYLRRLSMYVYLTQTQPNQSYSATGRAFGRDRTTVRHALDKVSFEDNRHGQLLSSLTRVRERLAR
ncbi:MAG: hypothetical protein KGR26_15350 [Cyanobacteria bacterium REEB65]|nr:hypothetical protein [Cyanobacteria bacterium REEB65]